MASIREYRDNKGRLKSYYIKVYRGRDINGKQLKPWSTTFKVESEWSEKRAKKEVERYAILFEEECKKGTIIENRITLIEYIEYIIELKKQRGQLKKRTISRWKHDAKIIEKEIGYIRIKDLRVSDLNGFYTSLKLSAKSINEIHRLISMVLNYAVKEDLIEYNIANKAEPPKLVKKEVNYFQREDIINILKYADEENLRHRVLIYLFVYTGCRRGEIAGLRWEDVDFNNKTIHICNNVLYTPEDGVYEDTPKTAKSDRTIAIPDILIELLKELRNEVPEAKYIVSNDIKPIHPDSISTYLTRFSKKYKLPHISSHAFRHTMASMLYFEGVDPVSISNRLGHSRVSITSDIYAHKVSNYDEKNVKTLENLYFVEK